MASAGRAAGGTSLRFFGNGVNGIDRVKIRIDDPARPADVGATDFTLEWWMKAVPGENLSSAVACNKNDGWITGNIVFDRDVFGPGDHGDFGVSLTTGRIAFGVSVGGTGKTICGATDVADGAWHHIGVTRSASTGQLRIFVDGQLDGEGPGPTGDASYRDGRTVGFSNDRFLVIGAEKHDAGPAFPSYSGWIDEVRLSTVLRYTRNFTRPTRRFTPDAHTVALYHFDEDTGDTIADSSEAPGGPSHGVRRYGGSPPGPEWSTDVPTLGTAPFVTLQPVVTGLDPPVAIAHAGDGSGRLFIVLQAGRILISDGAQLLPSPFLDISALVACCGERGLLSVAFHPQYATNGLFYVYYTDSSGDIVIRRYAVSSDPNAADPASGLEILKIPHPTFSNHNGGPLQFGPDGYLYAGVGDGGGGGDPSNNAQNLGTLLGKLLRIDVDGGPPYAIPPSNPFLGTPGARGEIWARGLRNPWRLSFDRATGDLFIGDVGQGAREEIDFEPAQSPGGRNYGWRLMEGNACFDPPSGCNDGSLTLPILTYGHSGGKCAVTGGYRYRGSALPALVGSYVYGDYCSGRIWEATEAGPGVWTRTRLLDTTLLISTFGEDESGELYVAHHAAGQSGAIHRLVPAGVPEVTPSPSALAFGSVAVGSKSDLQIVTVENDGTADLRIGSLSLAGPNPGQFRKPTASDGCSAQTLAPGQTCTVRVRFRPGRTGPKSATLLIPSNDPDDNPVAVTLSGTGTP